MVLGFIWVSYLGKIMLILINAAESFVDSERGIARN